jgi:hypothetical protein
MRHSLIRVGVIFAALVLLPAVAIARPAIVAPTPDLTINEILYWPGTTSDPGSWIEIHNPGPGDVALVGWRLKRDSQSGTVQLPEWILPAGAYLVVYTGAGTDDPDFSDGAGDYHAGGAVAPLQEESDGVGLYRGATIVDFVCWSRTGGYEPGVVHDDAVAAGQWTDGDFYDALQTATGLKTRPVMAGETIGRDRDSTDSDDPDDWFGLGGIDAVAATPGAQNLHVIEDLLEGPAAALQAEGGATIAAPAKKAWTVMVYRDYRDFKGGAWDSMNAMESVGSDANVNVVFQLADPTISLRVFMQKDDHPTKIRSPFWIIGGTNPGDPAGLTGFINWTEANYPADRYLLVIDGHGAGWKGVLVGDDLLTMTELKDALGAFDTKVDVVWFYACMMGQLEVARQIADEARGMVATEDLAYDVFEWAFFIEQLEQAAAAGVVTPGRLADKLAAYYSIDHKHHGYEPNLAVAAVDLARVKNDLVPKVDALGSALLVAMESLVKLNDPDDNIQIRVKHEAQEAADKFAYKDFKDLGHFAELVKPITASAQATAVDNALQQWGSGGIRALFTGSGHADSHGLSIYFPHDLVLPNDICIYRPGKAADPCDNPYTRAFDYPWPSDHLYATDAAALVPRVAAEDHALAGDPGFLFPTLVHWDEFLHRYYKPVADACIIKGGRCVNVIVLPVGAFVPLSGQGSSDADGPTRNDVPDNNVGVERFYWDFYTRSDSPAAKPEYKYDTHYPDCDTDDCDRNDVDTVDDDHDAQGRRVDFHCTAPGTYFIRLMVWDEHNDQVREHYENPAHNGGKHWIHFNVDDDWLKVTCLMPPATKTAWPYSVALGDTIHYEITLPASSQIGDGALGWVNDPLPMEVTPDGLVTCNFGTCALEDHTVVWEGMMLPGAVLEMSFDVTYTGGIVIEGDVPEFFWSPTYIINTATAFDGYATRTLRASTVVSGVVVIPGPIDPWIPIFGDLQ